MDTEEKSDTKASTKLMERRIVQSLKKAEQNYDFKRVLDARAEFEADYHRKLVEARTENIRKALNSVNGQTFTTFTTMSSS